MRSAASGPFAARGTARDVEEGSSFAPKFDDAGVLAAVATDADTGDVIVAQFRALDHGDDGNDHDSAVSMASGLIELEATALA